jgi:stage II sporulation protein D
MSTLERLTVTRRSRSGRVVGLLAVGAGGATTEWTGFEIRQVLELPETLFAMHLRTKPDGERVVHFLGRGWGHGVGLCQNGAYGMARAGLSFERILGHYYTGIEIIRWDDLQSTR